MSREAYNEIHRKHKRMSESRRRASVLGGGQKFHTPGRRKSPGRYFLFYYSLNYNLFWLTSFDRRHPLIVPDWDSAKNPRHSCVRNFRLWEVSRIFPTLPRCVSARALARARTAPLRSRSVFPSVKAACRGSRQVTRMDRNIPSVVGWPSCLYVSLVDTGIFCGPGDGTRTPQRNKGWDWVTD